MHITHRILTHTWMILATLSVYAVEEKFFPLGENLIADGIPKVPYKLIDEVDAYSEFRSASFLSWHPERREMLINTRFSDVSHVHLVKMPGGARTQLTFRKETSSGASFQPTHGGYFILTRDINGSENFQKYRVDMDTKKVSRLTDGKSRHIGTLWSTQGDRIVFSSNKRNGKDMDLWVMDPLKPDEAKIIMESDGGGWSALDWSPDDKTILLHESISINESYLWLLDVATGKKTPLIERSKENAEPVAYGGGIFSVDGQGLFITTDRDCEASRIAYIDLATKRHAYLTTNTKWSVENFSVSKDNHYIAYSLNEDGVSVLHVMDTQGTELAIPKMPAGQISGLSWHSNCRDLAFGHVHVRAPMDVYSFNVGSGAIERWTESETGGLDCSHFVEPELIKWKSFDGREISGLLYRPPASFTGKRPVIVDIHGGPEGQSRPGFLGKNNFLIEKLGVVMIFPNVRGSIGYGKTFMKLDNGFKREDSYKDLGALLDWIGTRDELDASRIMVMGGSYGGHMTLVAATRFAERIRCAIDIVGISNLATLLKNTAGYRQDLRRVEYGDERDPKMSEFMERIAPLNNVDKATKPLFIVQGANDPRVPKSEAEQMVAAVKKRGTPVWYLLGKNEGHGFANSHNKNYLFYATVLFMRQYLLN